MGKYEPSWEDVQKDIAKRIDELFQLREENKKLKEEIARLKELYKPDFDNVDLED